MTKNSPTCELERPAPSNTREALICEVRRGLLRRPRSLSSWMFYDSKFVSGDSRFERLSRRHAAVFGRLAARRHLRLDS